MARPPCREFTTLDAMILVAGLAVGVVGIAGNGHDLESWPEASFATLGVILGYTLRLSSGLVLALRLRRPRPPLRRVLCQPGAVACFAVVAYALLLDLQSHRGLLASLPKDSTRAVGWTIWWAIAGYVDGGWLVVPISWILLAISRRWRPEPGWIDRSGTILGWAWIAWGLASPWYPP